ncbi:MAG: hypothetical protein K6U11_01905 [bacterium]|nr:hypothetical protein [bacterium]
MTLKSLLKFQVHLTGVHPMAKLHISLVSSGIIIGLIGLFLFGFIAQASAQGLFPLGIYAGIYRSYLPAAGWSALAAYGAYRPLVGGIDPLYGSYYGSPFFSTLPYYSSTNPYNIYHSLMEICALYDYLNYALHFYELASQTPFLYLYDQTADYIGANLYNYARNIGVSPQESIIYFIWENFLSPEN